MWWKCILAVIIGYACGCLPSSMILVRVFNGADLRKMGSGSTGATNMLRANGWLPAILTLVLDTLKGVLAAFIGLKLGGEIAGIFASIAAIVGHNWPVTLGFKGGKGICTSWGVIMVLQPQIAFWLLVIVLAGAFATRMVSFGSIVVLIFYMVYNIFVSLPHDVPMFLFSVAVMCLGVFQHRSNIKRILANKENKLDLSKLHLFNNRGKK